MTEQKLNTNTETELIKLAKNGDEKAYEVLTNGVIEKCSLTLRKAFTNINEEDLKDAAQNALLKGWSKIKNFRADSTFSTWFYIILKNELLNIFDVKNRINHFEVPIEQINHQNIVETESEDYQSSSMLDGTVLETAHTILEKREDLVEYRKMLDYVMEKLSPNHSKILKMALEEEKSYKEIASELSLPIGSVMSGIFYGRQHAQKLIKQYSSRNELSLPLN